MKNYVKIFALRTYLMKIKMITQQKILRNFEPSFWENHFKSGNLTVKVVSEFVSEIVEFPISRQSKVLMSTYVERLNTKS